MQKHRHLRTTLAVLGVLLLAVGTASLQAEPMVVGRPTHHLGKGFRNLDTSYSYSMAERTRRLLLRTFERWPARGTPPAVVDNDGAELRANGTVPTVTWIGHATVLVQLAGVNILTDPIWSPRASPVGFYGPRRLVPPGMRFEDLPPIHAVVISHDHYDHLDEDTVRRLARTHRPRFFVPLGLKSWLAERGVTDVVELDWWQSATLGGLTFTLAPAQHSSGRGLHDQNRRLWGSWVIHGAKRTIWFAGDTGYTPALAEIGRRLGPIDVAAIPIGGYSAYDGHHPNHVSPEEALRLFEDVGARTLVPIHFSTYELNLEPFAEPPERLMRAAVHEGLEEHVALLSPGQSIHW